MIKEAKKKLLEIPNARDVYPEVKNLRDLVNERGEFGDFNNGVVRVPTTKYLGKWLDKINQAVELVEERNAPKNLQEEKLIVLQSIASLILYSVRYRTLRDEEHFKIAFFPSQTLEEELYEKGYALRRSGEICWTDKNGSNHDVPAYKIIMNYPNDSLRSNKLF